MKSPLTGTETPLLLDDDGLNDALVAALQYEAGRTCYPDDFPTALTIPVARYSSAEFHALEMEWLWKRSWVCAGRTDELSGPGDFKRFDRLGRSVLIVHGKDGQIRAFNNVCRHRGALIATEPCGHKSRFTCPYHAWSYGLSGELLAISASRDFAGLSRTDLGLGSVRCEIWNGWIFVNFDDEASELGPQMHPVTEEMSGFRMADLRLKGHRVYPVRCNWKVAYDAFLEAYHVQFVHPETVSPMLDPDRVAIALFDRGHSRMAMGKRTNLTGGTFAGEVPQDYDIPSVPLLFRNTFIAYGIFPNIYTSVDAGGFPFVSIWPTSVDSAEIEVYIIGHGGQINPAEDAYWTRMLAAFDTIMAEDINFLSGIQAAIASASFPAMNFGYQERRIYWLNEEIDRRIGVDRIPSDLRVAQRLGNQKE